MDPRLQDSTNIKIKKMTRIYEGSTKFPKLEECAHFHYDFVELRPIQVAVVDVVQLGGAATAASTTATVWNEHVCSFLFV